MTTKSNEAESIRTDNDSPATGVPVKVMLVDSDRGFMDAVQKNFLNQPDYKIVACVDSAKDALIWSEEKMPDVIIMDWHLMFETLMPAETKGLTLMQRLKANPHPASIIIASRYSQDEHRNCAFSAGADEFMPKAQFPQLLRPLIKRILSHS